MRLDLFFISDKAKDCFIQSLIIFLSISILSEMDWMDTFKLSKLMTLI